MSNEIKVYLNQLPHVTGVGRYYVDSMWKHIDRKVPIHVLIFVIEGTLYVTEDGIDYSVAKNNMIILKANSEQTGFKYIQPGSNWFWVNFTDIDDESQAGDKLETMELPKVMTFANPHTFRLRMESMFEIQHRNEPFKMQQLNGSLYRIFTNIMVQAQMDVSKTSKKFLAPKVIEILKSQVKKVFDSKEIARELDLNYSYISRKFREETGESVKRFYQTLEVNEAIVLLQKTNMTIAQISEVLNFPNPYQFSRVFKQVKGIAPGGYRKQLY